MGAKLLDAITNRLCSHQFAWPRRRASGDYYQVCVLCGAEYSYDWSTMTRTGRIEPGVKAETAPTGHRTRRRTNWVPRARRLSLHVPMRFREKDAEKWFEGTVENISQSGVAFHAHNSLPHDTDVEMIFEMPEEITGQPNRRVLCVGYVVRAGSRKGSPAGTTMASAISGYVFLGDQDPSKEHTTS